MGHLARTTAVIACLVVAPSVACAADEAAAAEAAAANASSSGAIHTLYARVRFQIIPGPRVVAMLKQKQTGPNTIYVGEYWREPGTVRVRQTCELGQKGHVIDFLRANGQTRAVTRSPGPKPNTVIAGLLVTREWRHVIMTDAWRFGLFELPREDGEEKPSLSVAEAVRQMKVKQVKTESGPKGPLTRITLDGGDAGVYTVWLDPAVNGLTRKVVREIKGGQAVNGRKLPPRRDEYEVADFAEVAPAIYFPTKMTLRDYVDGEHSVTHEAVFTDVKVNALKAPPFPMRLPTAAGMAATDEITGTTYTTDADGKPAGKQSVLRYAPAISAEGGRSDPFALPEPSAWSKFSTWLIVLSVLLALAAGVLIVRRRRAEPA